MYEEEVQVLVEWVAKLSRAVEDGQTADEVRQEAHLGRAYQYWVEIGRIFASELVFEMPAEVAAWLENEGL